MSARWEFGPGPIDKARDYIAGERVSPDPDVPGVWWVRGSDPSRRYRVQTDADPVTRRASWITCTCPHGLHQGAGTTRCSHAIAVLLLIRSQV